MACTAYFDWHKAHTRHLVPPTVLRRETRGAGDVSAGVSRKHTDKSPLSPDRLSAISAVFVIFRFRAAAGSVDTGSPRSLGSLFDLHTFSRQSPPSRRDHRLYSDFSHWLLKMQRKALNAQEAVRLGISNICSYSNLQQEVTR